MSEAERTFIVHGVQDNFRGDGRGCEDYRHVDIETDVLSNASGSAKLSLGNTDVLVGVKVDITQPTAERQNEGRLEFFVDFSANAAPAFEGRGGEELAAEIGAVLSRTYDQPSCLDLKPLCLIPRQQCWVINVDVVLLQCGGNLLDAVGLAVKAALFSTRIPSIRVTCTERGDTELEISDDPYQVTRLDVSNLPTVVTVNKIGHSHVVDATEQEEECTLARVYLAVDDKGNLAYLRKAGGGSLDPESVFDMVETGKKVGMSLNSALKHVLKESETHRAKCHSPVGFLH